MLVGRPVRQLALSLKEPVVVDILDLLLDDDEPAAAKPAIEQDDSEADLDLLLEEFSSSPDVETKKASLRAILAMVKK